MDKENTMKEKKEERKEELKKRNWEIAEELLNDNMTINRISEIANVPIDQIELLNNNKI